MAGPISALKIFRNKSFLKYRNEMIRILKVRIRPLALKSGDAGILKPDWSVTKLLQAARTALATHAARKDNPHGETMNTIGSYTAPQVDGLLVTKIPRSIVPLSHFGWLDSRNVNVATIWTSAAFKITCTKAVPIVMSGVPYTMPTGTLDLAAADPSPANKTFYLFVKLRFGQVQYQVRTDSPPESATVMYVGTITTNASGVASIVVAPVVRISTFRPSLIPRGSVIPVSAGTIDAPTKLPATWNPL
ncbi:hypothetical protein D3C85_244940 [compost metagenome]